MCCGTSCLLSWNQPKRAFCAPPVRQYALLSPNGLIQDCIAFSSIDSPGIRRRLPLSPLITPSETPPARHSTAAICFLHPGCLSPTRGRARAARSGNLVVAIPHLAPVSAPAPQRVLPLSRATSIATSPSFSYPRPYNILTSWNDLVEA